MAVPDLDRDGIGGLRFLDDANVATGLRPVADNGGDAA